MTTGSTRNADMDRIYDRCDELMREGKWTDLDIDLNRVIGLRFVLSTHQMLAYLTATLPAKSKLQNRKLLYRSVRDEIVRRGVWEPGLLDGLE